MGNFCIFCSRKRLDVVYETEHSMVITNILPALIIADISETSAVRIGVNRFGIQVPTFLVIPKEHYKEQNEFYSQKWLDLTVLTSDVIVFLTKAHGFKDSYSFTFPSGHSMKRIDHYHNHVPALNAGQRLVERIKDRPKITPELSSYSHALFREFEEFRKNIYRSA